MNKSVVVYKVFGLVHLQYKSLSPSTMPTYEHITGYSHAVCLSCHMNVNGLDTTLVAE